MAADNSAEIRLRDRATSGLEKLDHLVRHVFHLLILKPGTHRQGQDLTADLVGERKVSACVAVSPADRADEIHGCFVVYAGLDASLLEE